MFSEDVEPPVQFLRSFFIRESYQHELRSNCRGINAFIDYVFR